MEDEVSYSKVPKYPEEEFKDTLTRWAKAGINLIPVVGNTAAEAFGILISPKLEQRREQFLRDLLVHIERLSRKVEAFKPEKLKENDVFISMLIEATRISIKSHQKEKHEALRNAVLNSVISIDISDDIKNIYMRLLDSITPLHINILLFFIKNAIIGEHENFNRYYESYQKSENYLKITQQIFIKIAEDLASHNLLQPINYSPAIGKQEIRFSMTPTGITTEFLNFIKTPEL